MILIASHPPHTISSTQPQSYLSTVSAYPNSASLCCTFPQSNNSVTPYHAKYNIHNNDNNNNNNDNNNNNNSNNNQITKMRALTLIAATIIPLTFAHPLSPSHIEAPSNPNIIADTTCKQYVATHPETEFCAELTDSKDCSGFTTVIVGTECLDIKGAGSINVIRGSVFAGHGYAGCQGNPVFFAGRMYYEQQQGCQSWGRSTILSWRAG